MGQRKNIEAMMKRATIGGHFRHNILSPHMEYYREVYKDSNHWVAGSVEGRTVICYMEQGAGDIIQYLRYIPILKSQCETLILHVPKNLHTLIKAQEWDVSLIDKKVPFLPDHDVHVLSLELSFLLAQDKKHPLVLQKPYMSVPNKKDIPDGFNIGVCWEGSPRHLDALVRACPLKYFRVLEGLGNLYCLQVPIHTQKFVEGCEDMELLGVEIKDYLDTAELINALDVVVCVDTSVMHLAGAMGKEVYAALSKQCDDRWIIKEGLDPERSMWYPSVTLIRQKELNVWEDVFDEIYKRLI